MFEKATHADADIPEEVMLGRLAQSEQMREFFIQMWLQNPALAEHAGRTVQEILVPWRRPAETDFHG
jgi:hypothetical protein